MSFRIFAHGVGDGSVTLTKKDNTEKLITKHRKAAKMIGELIKRVELEKDEADEYYKRYKKYEHACASYANDIAQLHSENAYLRMGKKRLDHENHKLQGEIRALERTIDKLIEAGK